MSNPDSQDNPFASPQAETAPPLLPPLGPGAYEQVPFYRRNSFCSNIALAHALVVVLSVCGCRPLVLLTPMTGLGVIIVCIIVLTGPVYYKKIGKDGQLKQWNVANRVAAVILLLLFVVGPAVLVALYLLSMAQR